MNKTQKKFILKKLIPFILREQGNGFTMDEWVSIYTKDEDAAVFQQIKEKYAETKV